MGSSLSRSYVEEAHPGVTRATARNTRRNSTEARSYDAVARLSRLETLIDELTTAYNDKNVMKDERYRIQKMKKDASAGRKVDAVTVRELQREIVKTVAEAWGKREVLRLTEQRRRIEGDDEGSSRRVMDDRDLRDENEENYDCDGDEWDSAGGMWWENRKDDRPRRNDARASGALRSSRFSFDNLSQRALVKARRVKSVNFDERVIVRRLPPSPSLDGSDGVVEEACEEDQVELTGLDLLPLGGSSHINFEQERGLLRKGMVGSKTHAGTSSPMNGLPARQGNERAGSSSKGPRSPKMQNPNDDSSEAINGRWGHGEYKWIAGDEVDEVDGEDAESLIMLKERSGWGGKPKPEAKGVREGKAGKKHNKQGNAAWGEGREKRAQGQPRREKGIRREKESGRIKPKKSWAKSRPSLDLKSAQKDGTLKGKKKNSIRRGLGNMKRAVLLLPPSAGEAKPVKLRTKYGKRRKQKETPYAADGGTTTLLASRISQELWHFTANGRQKEVDSDAVSV